MTRESDLLRHIYHRSARLSARDAIALGPGDDAAALHMSHDVLLTVDQLIEGRHYTLGTPVADIAHKAVARSVSDIAAMAGRPRAGLCAACLRTGTTDADTLFDAVARAGEALDCPLVGGDIAFADGPTILTVTVIGTPHPERGPVTRSGARPGDAVCVTGKLGGSFASGRHLALTPRVAEASQLADSLGTRLTSMIDISDGLGRDLARVAEASGVRIVLDAAALPRHDDVSTWLDAASDGEDYELAFTVTGTPPETAHGTPITVIGIVEEGAGCVARGDEGSLHDLTEAGWDHQA
ncbi:MAG: thiamine-phosphate kinase [Planctomycetota bacterium]